MAAIPSCSRCGSAYPPAWGQTLCPACTLEFGVFGYPNPSLEPPPEQHTPSDLPVQRRPSDALPRFNDFEVLEEIGAGGMGVVYRVLQISLNRIVALKCIRNRTLTQEEDRRRFRMEAEAAAKLRHPGIVAIHEVGEEMGQPFYTMEFVPGSDLGRIARQGPLPPERAARYLHAVALAIHHAHKSGVLHRDLKPSNLIIDEHDQPRVLDFGLAKSLHDDPRVTGEATLLGSPAYMSPEQASADSHAIGPWSDVYSLGAVLYELLTGRAPFQAPTPLQTLRLVQETDPLPPRSLQPQIPRDLETICLKCLAKSPRSRYHDALALGQDLQRFLSREPIVARPVGFLTRSTLWARRNPGIAALTLALLLAFIGGTVAVLFEWRQEHQQRLRALDSERKARLSLYAVDMNLALQAVESGQLGRARDILAPYAVPARTDSHPPSDTREVPGSDLPASRLADGTVFDPRGFEWRYLWHASRGDPHRRLLGHQSTVSGLVLSPDGTTVYSCGFDGVVRAQTLGGTSVFVRSNTGGLHPSSLTVHPTSGRIALGSDHAHPGLVFHPNAPESVHLPGGNLGQVRFSPDGRWLISGALTGWVDATGPLSILSSEGESLQTLTQAGARCAFSRDGSLWATGTFQDRVRLWSWPGTVSNSIPQPIHLRDLGPVGALMTLAISPDGTQLATGNALGELQVWETVSARSLRRTPGKPEFRFLSLQFSPDSRQIATGGEDRLLRIWDAESLTVTSVHQGHSSGIWSLAWTADGKSIVTGGGDGTVRVWPNEPPPSREQILEGTTVSYFHSAIAFSPDSRWLTASVTNGSVGLWNSRTGERTAAAPLAEEELHAAFSKDSAHLFVSLGHREIRQLSVPELIEKQRIPLENPGPMKVTAVCLSDAGRWLAGVGGSPQNEGTIFLWDAQTGRHTATLRGHSQRIRGLRFSPDNHWLASGSADETARLWDLTTFRETAVLRGAANAITVLSFAPDSRTLASGGWDGVLRLWSVPEGTLLRTTPPWESPPVPEFMPDGHSLAIMVEHTGIRLYHLEARRDTCILRWPGARPYRYLRCSPDGQIIATQSQDGRVKLWHAPTAEESPL